LTRCKEMKTGGPEDEEVEFWNLRRIWRRRKGCAAAKGESGVEALILERRRRKGS